jgi:hypothetical protein
LQKRLTPPYKLEADRVDIEHTVYHGVQPYRDIAKIIWERVARPGPSEKFT